MNLNNKSWKTTAAGIAAILVAIGTAVKSLADGDPTTNIDIGSLVAAVMAGVGLICARDNDKSSEDVAK